MKFKLVAHYASTRRKVSSEQHDHLWGHNTHAETCFVPCIERAVAYGDLPSAACGVSCTHPTTLQVPQLLDVSAKLRTDTAGPCACGNLHDRLSVNTSRTSRHRTGMQRVAAVFQLPPPALSTRQALYLRGVVIAADDAVPQVHDVQHEQLHLGKTDTMPLMKDSVSACEEHSRLLQLRAVAFHASCSITFEIST
jgi:hypothetical protein